MERAVLFLCVFVKKWINMCAVTYKSIVQFFKFVNSDILYGMWENQTIRGKKNIELAKYTNQHLRNIIIRKRQGNNNIVNLYKTVREAALFFVLGLTW